MKKKVLITGVNGFIGTHLLDKCIKLFGQENVFGIDIKKKLKNTKTYYL